MNHKSKMPPALALLTTTLAVFVVGGAAGCASKPGPYLPQDTAKYTLENTEAFVLLDRPTQHSITCTGLNEKTLPDGRLEVVANVKNREDRRLQVQVSCVFKDAGGAPTGDETPWRNLILSEYETQAVSFTAMMLLR